MGISCTCAHRWVSRHSQHGDFGLYDRSSVPRHQPSATSTEVIAHIEQLRRDKKWSATRITVELGELNIMIARSTVTKILAQLGLPRRRFIDPTGESNRTPGVITALRPGHMVHSDVTKVGKIPDGGGWKLHGRGKVSKISRLGHSYLHSAVDANSRLVYTEVFDDETAASAAEFLRNAMEFFEAQGITQIERVVTDNKGCYHSEVCGQAVARTSRHQRIAPYTPRHNGKVECYQRIMVEDVLYARSFTSEAQRREAIAVWNVHYNYYRPHSMCAGQPPASQLRRGVTNVHASYN